MLLFRSTFIAVSSVVVIAAILVGCDFFLRANDVTMRWLLFVLFSFSVFSVTRRWLWPLWHLDISNVCVARWIEERVPDQHSGISSAVDFLRDEYELTGMSRELRERVIHDAQSQLESIEVNQFLSRSSVVRPAIVLAFVLFAVVVAAMAAPTSASVGLVRLLLPWTNYSWPLRDDLDFQQAPDAIAIGADVEVEVVDRIGLAPRDLRVAIRPVLDTTQFGYREILPVRGNRFVIPNVRFDIEIAALGGDDDSPNWHRIQVHAPPVVSNLQYRYIWPAYLQADDFLIVEGTKLLAGGFIEIQASTNSDVVTANLIFHPTQGPINSNSKDHEPSPRRVARLSVISHQSDKLIRSPDNDRFLVEKSGRLWINLVDSNGLISSTAPLSIQAISDRPPECRTRSFFENPFATQTGRVRFRVVSRDDVGIQEVNLSILDQFESELLVLDDEQTDFPILSRRGDSDEVSCESEFAIDIGQLNVGTDDVMSVSAEAVDLLGQRSTSEQISFEIVSNTEFRKRCASRLRILRNDLAELQASHAALRNQLQAALHQGSQQPMLLRNGQVRHEKHRQTIAGSDPCLLTELRQLALLFSDNLANASESVAILIRQIASRVESVEHDVHVEVSRLFESEIRRAEVVPNSDFSPFVSRVTKLYEKAESEFGDLIQKLGESQEYTDTIRQLEQVQVSQASILQQTSEMQKDAFRNVSIPRDAIERLAATQDSLARQLETLSAVDPSNRAIDDSQKSKIAVAVSQQRFSSRMRRASENIEAAHFGQAIDVQMQINEGLLELMDRISNGRASTEFNHENFQASVASMLAAQKKLLSESLSFSETSNDRTKLGRQQTRALLNHAEAQRSLAEDTRRWDLAELERAFQLIISRVHAEMESAALLLKGIEIEPATRHQKNAIELLESLSSASLQPLPKVDPELATSEDEKDFSDLMPQLVLVLKIQERINRGSTRLSESSHSNRPVEFLRLAELQDDLIALIEGIETDYQRAGATRISYESDVGNELDTKVSSESSNGGLAEPSEDDLNDDPASIRSVHELLFDEATASENTDSTVPQVEKDNEVSNGAEKFTPVKNLMIKSAALLRAGDVSQEIRQVQYELTELLKLLVDEFTTEQDVASSDDNHEKAAGSNGSDDGELGETTTEADTMVDSKIDVGIENRREFAEKQWGHLPDKLRDRLLSVSGSEIPPMHREHVEEYFRLLMSSRP